jgi:hypothetical protein
MPEAVCQMPPCCSAGTSRLKEVAASITPAANPKDASSNASETRRTKKSARLPDQWPNLLTDLLCFPKKSDSYDDKAVSAGGREQVGTRHLCCTKNRGKTISLKQQGIQTEINSKKKMTMYEYQKIAPPRDIIMCKSEAQVLSRTCPE